MPDALGEVGHGAPEMALDRANIGKELCILRRRNPRIGEPASALRTIFCFLETR